SGKRSSTLGVANRAEHETRVAWHSAAATGGAPERRERWNRKRDERRRGVLANGHPSRDSGEAERVERSVLHRDGVRAGRYAVKDAPPPRVARRRSRGSPSAGHSYERSLERCGSQAVEHESAHADALPARRRNGGNDTSEYGHDPPDAHWTSSVRQNSVRV